METRNSSGLKEFKIPGISFKEDVETGKNHGVYLIGNDGNVKIRFGFPRIKSVQDIRDGRYRVPELKKLEGYEQPSTDPYDDVPF